MVGDGIMMMTLLIPIGYNYHQFTIYSYFDMTLSLEWWFQYCIDKLWQSSS